MTLILDAAPLVAHADEREPRREEILELLRSERGGLFVPAPVTAEIDYLLGRRFGPPARRAFLEDLAARRYESPGLDARDYAAAVELDRRYADLDIGLADLSIAVLAGRLGTPSSPSTNATSASSGPYTEAHSRCSPPTPAEPHVESNRRSRSARTLSTA